MKLIFKSQYRSINNPLPDIDLPPFTLITGLNGSGKTHLLEAIIFDSVDVLIDERIDKNIVYFNYTDFVVKQPDKNKNNQPQGIRRLQNVGTIQFDLNEIQETISKIIEEKRKELSDEEKMEGLFSILINQFIQKKLEFVCDEKAVEKLKQDLENCGINISDYDENQLSRINDSFNFIISKTKEIKKFKKYYGISIKKQIHLLQLKAEHLMSSEVFLGQQLEQEFRAYRQAQQENDFKKVRSSRGEKIDFLDETEFVKKYGKAPWDFMNEILKEYQCNGYQIDDKQLLYPELYKKPEEFQMSILLYNERIEDSVHLENLSSGEKTLMALALNVYQQRKNGVLPNILLLDEIDTNLHPSMIQQLLNVIQKVFIEEYGMHVVMVTHSPTTVALAPEESIVTMSQDPSTRFKASSKQEAMDILTEGFATLDKGLRLFDQVGLKDVSIITEGKNIDFIASALELYDASLISKVDIISGVTDCSGKSQLKTIFDFFSKVQHNKKVIIVWDCDADREYRLLTELNNTTPFIFSKNLLNTVTNKGIENLFADNLFDGLVSTTTKPDGSVIKNFDSNLKDIFREKIIQRKNKDDFKLFTPLIELIKTKIT